MPSGCSMFIPGSKIKLRLEENLILGVGKDWRNCFPGFYDETMSHLFNESFEVKSVTYDDTCCVVNDSFDQQWLLHVSWVEEATGTNNSCHYHNINTGFVEDSIDLLSSAPRANSVEFSVEQDLAKLALNTIASRMKRQLREWPVCGWSGRVDLAPIFNRKDKRIEAVWKCSCGGRGP